MSWILEELAGIDLGDKRLDARAAVVLEALGLSPTLNIPAACRGWNDVVVA